MSRLPVIYFKLGDRLIYGLVLKDLYLTCQANRRLECNCNHPWLARQHDGSVKVIGQVLVVGENEMQGSVSRPANKREPQGSRGLWLVDEHRRVKPAPTTECRSSNTDQIVGSERMGDDTPPCPGDRPPPALLTSTVTGTACRL